MLCRPFTAASAGVVLAAVASAAPPVLDGAFDDWSDVETAFSADDPRGDATGGFDVLNLAGHVEGATLYLKLSMAKPLNLQSGPREEGTLALRLELPDGQALVVNFRARTAVMAAKEGNGGEVPVDQPIPWASLNFEALPTYASEQQELRLDLASLGINAGDEVTLRVLGSDEVEPQTITFTAGTEPAKVTLPTRPADGFRVANANVLWNGLADEERGPRLGRMLAAADADAFTLQETIAQADQPDRNRGEEPDPEGAAEATAASLSERLGGEWNVVADGLGCVVASRHPLQAVEVRDARAAAAIVDVDGNGFDETDPLVASIHLKCCGYAGSDEDLRRMGEVVNLARSLRRAADGRPVVVAGDFNLVGSSLPRDLLMSPLTLGLEEVVPLQLGDGSATTWRGLRPNESFWPGRLDLVLHSPTLDPLQSFAVDTADLDLAALEGMGLRSDDSLGSDHLLLVTDFAIGGK